MKAAVKPGVSRLRPLLARVLTLTLLTGVIVAIYLLFEDDISGLLGARESAVVSFLRSYGYLGGFLLLYLEESGIPLFVPGDAFVIYIGHRLPGKPLAWAGAWAGMTAVVTLGASNLYWLSRWLGRRLIEHRLAPFLHMTPARVASAERAFQRWGPWALIIGRHIPGLRVPLTLAAGALGIDYRTFVFSVAVSSAGWSALFLTLGIVFGPSVGHFMR